jgi:hypothetical protein
MITAGEGSTRPTDAASSTRTYRSVTRAGFAVNGALHVLIGIIALSISPMVLLTPDAESVGALRAVSANPGGAILFWTVAVGYALLGLWMLVSLILTRLKELTTRQRAVMIGRGLSYLVLGFSSGSIAIAGRNNPQADPDSLAATVLQLPVGALVIVLFGLLILIVATYFVRKGWRRTYLDDIRLPARSSGRRPVIIGGRIAYLGKGIALGIVGALVLVAGFLPSSPAGLGGKLAAVALTPAGPLLLGLVGLGLIAYGFYCGARARLAHV